MVAAKAVVKVSGDGQPTQPLEMVVGAQSLPLLPKEYSEELRKLLPIASDYQWFSQTHWALASQCTEAMVAAWRKGGRGVAYFFATAVIDLYHRDRAERACALLREPAPLREVPKFIARLHEGQTTQWSLSLNQLTAWSTEIPLDQLSRLALVGREAPPDDLHLAVYHPERSGRRDPLIYARYGDWYVKVVEWE